MEYKKGRKTSKKFIPLLAVVFSLLFSISAAAYEVPSDSYYANLQTRELGEIMVYFPYNVARYLSYDEDSGRLINTYNSQISGYGFNGSWYSIRFPTFDVPTYRREDSSTTYQDLTITRVNETNITFLNDTDFTAFSSGTLSNLTMLLIGGCILLCLFMRR